MARRTPLETVREQFDKMQQGELQQVMALCAARMFTCKVVSPQTSLLDAKARIQRELLQKPFTEWADVVAPFIATCRKDKLFCERDVTRYEHHSRDERHMHLDPSHEAIHFLYNWPPHEGSAGTFKETRCCQLDPPIRPTTWYKSGPLHHYQFVDHRMTTPDGPYKVPV